DHRTAAAWAFQRQSSVEVVFGTNWQGGATRQFGISGFDEGIFDDLSNCTFFPTDSDGDGVPDDEDADSDDDGLTDLQELGVDASGDSDGDGLPDWADPDSP